MFVIDKIEGNSKIGVPVFSQIGKKSNFKFQVFQENYEEKREMLLRNRQETQDQAYLRRYKEIAEHFTKEKSKITDKLQQIEQALSRQKVEPGSSNIKRNLNNNSQNNTGNYGHSNLMPSKTPRKSIAQGFLTQEEQQQNTEDQYYQIHHPTSYNTYKEGQTPPPPLGHYNPKFSSIDKSNKSGIYQMEERRENEIAAKQLKEDQFLKKFQVCDKLQRAVHRNKQENLRQNIRRQQQNQNNLRDLVGSVMSHNEKNLQSSDNNSGQNLRMSNDSNLTGLLGDNLQLQIREYESPDQRSPKRQQKSSSRTGGTSSPNHRKNENTQNQSNGEQVAGVLRLNLNQTPLLNMSHQRNQSSVITQQQKQINKIGQNTSYYQELPRSQTTNMKRNRKLAQSIDQRNSQLLGGYVNQNIFNSYGENSTQQNTGTRIGSAITNGTTSRQQAKLIINQANINSRLNKLTTSSNGGDILSEAQVDTFRPINEVGFNGMNHNLEILEEFSVNDITYRTNKAITNRNKLGQNITLLEKLKTETQEQNSRQNQHSLNENAQKSRKVKSFDMTKSLPRNIEDIQTQSRKRPGQRASDEPKTLIYYPRYESVLRRDDKNIIPFTKIVSREQQPRSIYDKLKPQYNNLLTNQDQNIDDCYDKLGHVIKHKPPNFEKSNKRDLTYIMKGTEAYNNILRDNEKWEFRNMFRLKRQHLQSANSNKSLSRQEKNIEK
eukprot:403346296